jgi:glycerol-3-phosphate dehydrogenase
MIPDSTIHDLLIIGGGVNGAGIAADAAGRGLDVLLCEQNDLASGTSSASTKLIHGGLRYLENYEFRLVREALAEREVLLRNAPHIITPMRFQLPHRPHLRPRWMIQAGLFLYDSLSRRVTLPASRRLRFGPDSPLVDSLPDGFEYADAWVDDARLVVLLAMLAREKGARVLVRTRVAQARDDQGLWCVTLEDTVTGERQQVQARALVNAAGPWVEQVAHTVLPERSAERVRLVKGCHIVVPRLHPGEQAFLLQNADGRVVFVIPYEQDFSLIGTTDEDFVGDPASARIAPAEIDYLVKISNECFRRKISAADVLHHFAGVRPLLASDEANASKVSRDYTLTLDQGGAPLLTVHGGKITTYRRLAESAMDKLRAVFPSLPGSWTSGAALPGGDFQSRAALRLELQREFPWLQSALLERWLGHYGTRTRQLLGDACDERDLGEHFGAALYAREVRYLQNQEWARTAQDILWRRSKLGLWFTSEQVFRLQTWLSGARSSLYASQ